MVLHGAAPCPVAVKQAIIDWWGPVLLEYYAATEGTGTFVTSAEWLERPGTVGKPPTPDHVRILDPVSDEPLPAGEVGTVYLKAPPVGRFDYFGDPDKTAGSYRGDYFTMGDVGYLDEDGYLFLTDRSADLIISGGVNVYPAEVEAELLAHPDVGDAAVIGVPDPEWGEIVVAVVEPQAGVTPSDDLAAALVAHCRATLARFKCPRRVDFTDAPAAHRQRQALQAPAPRASTGPPPRVHRDAGSHTEVSASKFPLDRGPVSGEHTVTATTRPNRRRGAARRADVPPAADPAPPVPGVARGSAGRHRLARRRRHPRHRRRRAQRAPLGRHRLRPHRRGSDRLGRAGPTAAPGVLVSLVGAAVNAAAIGGWVLAKTSGISFVDRARRQGERRSSPTRSPRGSPRVAVVGAARRAGRPPSRSPRPHPALVGVAGVAVVALAIPGMVRTGSHSHAGGRHGAETAGTPTARRPRPTAHDHAETQAATPPSRTTPRCRSTSAARRA